MVKMKMTLPPRVTSEGLSVFICVINGNKIIAITSSQETQLEFLPKFYHKSL